MCILGSSIGQVSASDTDTGLEHGTVRYSIVSGDAQQQFSIDQSTGDVKLVKSLDRETTVSYTLSIAATDDAAGASTANSGNCQIYIANLHP